MPKILPLRGTWHMLVNAALNGSFNEDAIAMHFDGRELKPYAEPVIPSDLREGETYFMVQFIDEEMLVPVLEPIMYVGKNLGAGDVNQFYFQGASSFLAGVRCESGVSGGALLYKQAESEINHIFEFDKGLDVLLACSIRRSRREL